jgi:flagellar motor protein MotB
VKTRTSTAYRTFVAAIVVAVAGGGCASTPLHVASLDDAERARSTPTVREAADLDPIPFARADRYREAALQAHESHDDVAADLYAQRALAGYGHALASVRFARATLEQADAQKALDDASTRLQALDSSQAELERQATDLERRLRVIRDRRLPAASGAAPAERVAARRASALSLATEARLLCSAANVVAPSAEGLAAAADGVKKVTERLERRAGDPPIDDAARARAACLDVLTRVRRGTGDGQTHNDELLSDLSASGGGWDPSADERGVVVTLRGLFQGAELTDQGRTRLQELGRVAQAHPRFAVQIVVHDARMPAAQDPTDEKRAQAAAQALVAGGATASRIDSELAGAREPLADPSDPAARARNERIEVVFVGE